MSEEREKGKMASTHSQLFDEKKKLALVLSLSSFSLFISQSSVREAKLKMPIAIDLLLECEWKNRERARRKNEQRECF